MLGHTAANQATFAAERCFTGTTYAHGMNPRATGGPAKACRDGTRILMTFGLDRRGDTIDAA
jgi:hypothetical protein